jgi:hypothetical protein
MAKVTIHGLEALIAELKKFPEAVQARATQTGVRKASAKLRTAFRQAAYAKLVKGYRRTNRLRNSIRSAVGKNAAAPSPARRRSNRFGLRPGRQTVPALSKSWSRKPSARSPLKRAKRPAELEGGRANGHNGRPGRYPRAATGGVSERHGPGC